MDHRGHLLLLPPNRVWRSYPGGRTLDRLAGVAEPRDSSLSEDWIGSATESSFAGREHLHEGVATVQAGGQKGNWAEWLARDPEYFLGAEHVRRYGAKPMLLVKYLDSAIRLGFQAHPSAEFARKFLGSPSGKTEAYHILAVRPEIAAGYVYIGFQRPPAPAELRRMIEEQDIAALERCFDRIPVQPGDTFVIPGGFPHALGEGLFLVEIQEPTDLVARFEFERGGYVLPEAARFMGRGAEVGLALTDFTARARAEIEIAYGCPPKRRRALGPDSWQDDLIGPEKTACFSVRRSRLGGPVVRSGDGFYIGIVTQGVVTAEAGGEKLIFKTYDRFIVPAGIGPIKFAPRAAAAILECYPPG